MASKSYVEFVRENLDPSLLLRLPKSGLPPEELEFIAEGVARCCGDFRGLEAVIPNAMEKAESPLEMRAFLAELAGVAHVNSQGVNSILLNEVGLLRRWAEFFVKSIRELGNDPINKNGSNTMVSCIRAELCLFEAVRFVQCDWIVSLMQDLPITICGELLSVCAMLLTASDSTTPGIVRESVLNRAEEALWSGAFQIPELRRSFTKLFMVLAKRQEIEKVDVETLINLVPFSNLEEDSSCLQALKFVTENYEALQISDFASTLAPRIFATILQTAFEPSFRNCFSRMCDGVYASAQLIGRKGYSDEVFSALVADLTDKYPLLSVEEVQAVYATMFGGVSLEDLEVLMMRLASKAKQVSVHEIARHLTNYKIRSELFAMK
jgi:hypothetical protein